jgi:hypothetical protein
MNWLIDSDHHQGFLNEINQIKNVLSKNISDKKQLENDLNLI